GAGEDRRRGLVLLRRHLAGAQGPVLAALCGAASDARAGIHDAEHRRKRQQGVCRASHSVCSTKLGMTLSIAISGRRVAERAPLLLQVAALSKRYGEQQALTDVAFDVRVGEVL